jgi:uncharacterized BrkB/YihY/UPF0761 family membrane protein
MQLLELRQIMFISGVRVFRETAAHGAAKALVAFLLWVYYSSIILLFGAELTRAHALARNVEVRPLRYATMRTADKEV